MDKYALLKHEDGHADIIETVPNEYTTGVSHYRIYLPKVPNETASELVEALNLKAQRDDARRYER